jgi:hypothetical protein
MRRFTGEIGSRLLVVFLALSIVSILPLCGQERIGQINGVVTDPSGAAVPSATVTLTNLETNRATVVKSGGDGTYTSNVDPGHYKIRVEATGFSAGEIPDITVLTGKTLKVDAQLKVGSTTETVQVVETAPLIDTTTTQVAHNVTAEEFNRMPKSRTFQSLVTSSPTATTGDLEGGTQINGASAGENNYIVDGITTTSVLQGQSRTNAPFEILEEVQVKSSGIEAQYGGATGGVISAITRSGGNRFHGDVHYFYQGNGISAGPVKRLLMDPNNLITTGFVQDNKQKNDIHEPGYSFGGPFIKNRLYFFSAASPRFQSRDFLYLTTDVPLQRATLKQDATFWQAYNKISADITHNLRVNASYYWSPFHAEGRIPAYSLYGNQATSTAAALRPNQDQGYFNPQSNYGADVSYTVTPTTLFTVRFGRNWDNYKALGVPDRSAVEWGTPSVNLPFAIPDDLKQAKGFSTIPRSRTTLFDVATRTNLQFDLNKFLNFGGQHELKVGLGRMKNVNKVNEGYGGNGYITLYWDTPYNDTATKTSDRGQYGYYTLDDIGTKGSTGGTIDNLYIQDRWRPMKRLSLDLGIRFEKEVVPSFRRDIQDKAFEFDWTQKIAPRVGASYDVFGDGRFKVYGSFGLFYDWVKYELSRGTFGGDHWFQYTRSLDTLDVRSLGNGNLPGRNLFAGGKFPYLDNRLPSFGSDTLDPNLKPFSVSLSSIGAEYQVNPKLVVAARWTYNHLRNAIDDVGTLDQFGNEVYIYGNPGHGLTAKSSPSGITPSFPLPEPQRNYNALELSFNRRFANHFFLSGSYVYSRLYGNYAGITSTDEVNPPSTGRSAALSQSITGSVTRPGTSSSRYYDLDYLLYDSHGVKGNYGLLATDRPNEFKLYGSYELPWKKIGGTEIGGFFLAENGAPQTTQVMSTQNAPVYVNGRGDLGRAPFISQTDLMLSHTIKFGEGKSLRFEFNAQNVFNQKTAQILYPFYNRFRTNSSEINYTKFDFSKPYDYKALVAQTSDATSKPYGAIDPRFGKEDLFRTGFVGRFGVKFSF